MFWDLDISKLEYAISRGYIRNNGYHKAFGDLDISKLTQVIPL